MGRELVSRQRIREMQRLPTPGNFEVAFVNGWSCVVRRGEFKVNEEVLFFEIDSFLPPHTEDARYSNPIHRTTITWQGRKGVHVNSIMHGQVISQGVILKLSDFPELLDTSEVSLADQLGILKWELSPKEKETTLGKPPTFIPATDLERVQNCPNLFTAKYKNAIFQESTKMDGSSMTVYFVKKDSCWYRSLPWLAGDCAKADMETGRFGVCSRHADIPYGRKPASKFWEVALAHGLPGKLARVGRNLAVQGELVGSTIQANRHGFPAGRHDFYVFAIFDIDAQERLKPGETVQRAAQLGLQHVPVHGEARLHDIAKCHADLLKRAEGTGINGRKREGLVFKNVDDQRGFKVIANDYLLKHGEGERWRPGYMDV
ncbi:RNA ligase, DRB0094 family [Xylariomycetidae sp. FL0641]|nr:RNA ligase, DRB0094 family [Xylariomycetidae sp. FL0641]